MIPLQQFAHGVLADVVRRQPPSPARTAFAWELSVGASLARVTAVTLEDGRLYVRARDRRWAREIQFAAATILLRMQNLLGRTAVTRIEVVEAGGTARGAGLE